jgi:hypothetical protein
MHIEDPRPIEGISLRVVATQDEGTARRVAPLLLEALADLGELPAYNTGRVLHAEKLSDCDGGTWEVILEVKP